MCRRLGGEGSALAAIPKRSLRKMFDRRDNKPWVRDLDDRVSCEKRAMEEDGVRVLRMGSEEEAMVIIITPLQLQWLRAYGHRGISVDDTHHTTKYSLRCTTLMVMDDYDRGLPAALMLSKAVSEVQTRELFDVSEIFRNVLE